MKKIIAGIVATMLLMTGVAFADRTSVVNPVQVLTESFTVPTGWNDGGSAAATKAMSLTLPAGAIPIAWRATTTTAIDATSAATLLVGITGVTDKFSASDGQDIDAVGVYGDSALGEAVGADGISSAQTILLTLTEDSEWGDISAGAFTLEFFYLKP